MKVILSIIAFFISTNLLAASQAELLRPNEAFKLSTEVIDGENIRATWHIADGYFLYRNKIDFISESEESKIADFKKPAGKSKKDPTFGEVFAYRGQVSFDLPIERGSSEATKLALLSKSQGCADIAFVSTESVQSDVKKVWLDKAKSDAVARCKNQFNVMVSEGCCSDIIEWARENGLSQVVAMRPDVGPINDQLHTLEGINIIFKDRDEDLQLRPLAKAGFFGFWKKIEPFVRNLDQD